MKLGDTVTWRTRHFGIALQMTSAITEYQYPSRFVDEQLHGPFQRGGMSTRSPPRRTGRR